MRLWSDQKLLKGSLVLLPMIFSVAALAENLNPFAEREGPLTSATSELGANVDLSKVAATMTLQGTLVSADHPLANIDGVLYSRGDKIGGYIISKIDSDSVTLSRGDLEIALQIENSFESGRER